jgi:hypothetical protein
VKKSEFDNQVKRIKEVDAIIKSLDPTIREEAFRLFKSYITSGFSVKTKCEPPQDDDSTVGPDLEAFFTKLEQEKPSDNVLHIAAYHYAKYGSTPISVEEIKQIASEVGITLPARVDMTLNSAQREHKGLFTRAGRGKFKPTVHGEQFLKKTYDIKKGTQKKNLNNDE